VASLSGLTLTLKQTPTQQALKIVDLTYGYTLTCTDVECARTLSFDVSVDILGDDLVGDDLLATAVDRHIVECGATHLEPIEMRRSFVVGQSLLDEDIGTDEIKLRVWARDSSGGEISGVTGIVRGDF
jgi:hypothetical protein